MFSSISEKITNKLLENETISIEDKEIYNFGVKQIFTIVLNFITVITLGIIFQMLIQAVMFMLSFVPLRIYAGGAHAKTPLRCYLYSTIFLAIVLLVMRHVHIPGLIYCVLFLISSIIIIFLAPIQDNNKPLDELEKKIFKRRTIIFWMIESLVISVCFLFKFYMVSKCFIFSLFSVAIVVVLGAMKNKLKIEK